MKELLSLFNSLINRSSLCLNNDYMVKEPVPSFAFTTWVPKTKKPQVASPFPTATHSFLTKGNVRQAQCQVFGGGQQFINAKAITALPAN